MKSFHYILILIAAIPACAQDHSENSESEDRKASFVKTIKQDSTFTLVAVGDIMMGTNFPDASYLPPKDLFLLNPFFKMPR